MARDPKTHLKELADSGNLSPAEYSTRRTGGPDHVPGWVAEVRLPDGRAAEGTGRSKTEAEQNAAAALQQKHRIK
jgi:ribonuclease-3